MISATMLLNFREFIAETEVSNPFICKVHHEFQLMKNNTNANRSIGLKNRTFMLKNEANIIVLYKSLVVCQGGRREP